MLVTHHHGDHAEAALPWGARFGAQVAAGEPPRSPGPAAGCSSRASGSTWPARRIGVVPTPGHTADHLAFRLESGAVLVGDHVLGRGTSVVTHPGGRRPRLPRVAAAGARPRAQRALLRPRPRADRGPGRGPRLLPRPPRLPRAAAARRRSAGGPATVDELVATIYADVPAGGVAGRRPVDPGHPRQAARRGPGRGRPTEPVRLA